MSRLILLSCLILALTIQCSGKYYDYYYYYYHDGCFPDEVEIHISAFQGGYPGDYTNQKYDNKFYAEPGYSVEALYYLHHNRPFRFLFYNLTMYNQDDLIITQYLTNYTTIYTTINYPPSPYASTLYSFYYYYYYYYYKYGYYPDTLYNTKISFTVTPYDNYSKTVLEVTDLRVCIEVQTGYRLPYEAKNPCKNYYYGCYDKYCDFFFPYYGNPKRYIQCDTLGRAWVRECAFGTVFDDYYNTCIHKYAAAPTEGPK